jgi:hypothetical protein
LTRRDVWADLSASEAAAGAGCDGNAPHLEEDALKRIVIAAASLAALVGCGSPSRGVCNKAKECCSQTGLCDEMNTAGGVDRCAIVRDAYMDTFGTYDSESCKKVESTYSDYSSCLSGVSCSDISGDGTVAKCQAQALTYCNALKASGGACGKDHGSQSCDNFKANFEKNN